MANCLSAMLCGAQLVRDIVEDCDNPIFSGINATGVIINYDDILSVVRDAQNPHIIRNIVLVTGKRGYKFVQERNNPFSGSNTAANVNDFRNDFTSTVAGFIPLDGAEPARDIITPMANGRYVVIVNNQWLHTDRNNVVDNEWQIYGIDKGLRMSTLQQTRYENNDAWMVEFQETNVPRSATFLIPATCTDYTAEQVNLDNMTVNDDGTVDGDVAIPGESKTYTLDNAEMVDEGGKKVITATISGETLTLVLDWADPNSVPVVVSLTVCESGNACKYVQGLLSEQQ